MINLGNFSKIVGIILNLNEGVEDDLATVNRPAGGDPS